MGAGPAVLDRVPAPPAWHRERRASQSARLGHGLSHTEAQRQRQGHRGWDAASLSPKLARQRCLRGAQTVTGLDNCQVELRCGSTQTDGSIY